jgi:hypothetical protein
MTNLELEDKFLQVSKLIIRQVDEVVSTGLSELHKIAQEELEKHDR